MSITPANALSVLFNLIIITYQLLVSRQMFLGKAPALMQAWVNRSPSRVNSLSVRVRAAISILAISLSMFSAAANTSGSDCKSVSSIFRRSAIVGISQQSSSLDYSVVIDTSCTEELAVVFLTRNVGASNQLIVGRISNENQLDLIAVRDPDTSSKSFSYLSTSSYSSCFYPDIGFELSINAGVGAYDEAQEAGVLVKVPLFEIWAFEKQ